MAISLDTQDIEQRNTRRAGPTRLCMPGLQMRMPEILLLLIMMLLLLMMLLEILLLLMAMLLLMMMLALMLWQGQAGLHSSFQLMPIWGLQLRYLRLRIAL